MTIGKDKVVLTGVLMTLLLINLTSALTGSIGNAKMVLYPEVNGWTTTTIEKSINVKNVNDEYINVKLEADSDSKEFIEVVDSEFELYPGEEKDAKFLINVRKEGNYQGRINVFFSPIEGKSPGVVLSSTIVIIAKKDSGYEEPEEDEIVEDPEEEEDNNTGVNVFTGGAIGVDDKNSKSKVPLLLGVSSFVLLVVLVGLIFTMNKSKTKRKKSGRKKTSRKKK